MESPASSKPSASPEIRFPLTLAQLRVWIASGCRDVRQVCIAFGCSLVPPKHRINSLSELRGAPVVNATGIHPEELEAILSSSFPTEADFGIPSLALPSVRQKLVICDFFTLGPSVREYSVRRKVIGVICDQLEAVA